MNARVRFAPSPTGYLHLGGLRTALFNYLFARKSNGKIILRIEDTDRKRFVEGAMENLIETLQWAGLKFDEGPEIGGDLGPYVQSDRFDIYKQHVQILLDNGVAYHCFCTPERLTKMREESKDGSTRYDRKCLSLTKEEISEKLSNKIPHVVRLKMPHRVIRFNDMIRGDVEFSGELIDDQVILKSDGFPTYHLANVVDDHQMEITHVIRGEEWLSSVPKHIALYEGFGWKHPIFAHLPLILNSDKSKLSKRQGDVSVEDYMKKGFLSEAIVNYLALLGWNPGNDQEIFSMDQLCEEFQIEKVSKSGSVFDVEKLSWMNREYIRMYYAEKPEYIKKLIEKELKVRSAEGVDLEKFFNLCRLAIEKAVTIPEIVDSTLNLYHFSPDFSSEQRELLSIDEVKKFLTYSITYFGDRGCDGQSIKELLQIGKKEYKLKGKQLFMPLRLAGTGMEHGPDLKLVFSSLGTIEVCDRISGTLKCLS